jgi:hypothetical protein
MSKQAVEVVEKAFAFEGVQNPSFQVAGQVITCRSSAQHSAKRAKAIRNRISSMLSTAGFKAGVAIQEGNLNSSRQYAICIGLAPQA